MLWENIYSSLMFTELHNYNVLLANIHMRREGLCLLLTLLFPKKLYRKINTSQAWEEQLDPLAMPLPERTGWLLSVWRAAAWEVPPSCPIPLGPWQVLLEAGGQHGAELWAPLLATSTLCPASPCVLQLTLELLSPKPHLCPPLPFPKHHGYPWAALQLFPLLSLQTKLHPGFHWRAQHPSLYVWRAPGAKEFAATHQVSSSLQVPLLAGVLIPSVPVIKSQNYLSWKGP